LIDVDSNERIAVSQDGDERKLKDGVIGFTSGSEINKIKESFYTNRH